ncbi:MAG: transcriptional regulator [Xanthobacteraceae bacterium]|jgi:DNA-binding transcriptional LysR family regulator|nr:transcriptional regulator [Xanthobacteraceae bacterium]
MTSLNELQIFGTVVEHGGFAAAAKALGVTRSAVCRRIDGLEKRLGVRLLDRTTRRISLTDAGEALYHRGSRILAEVQEAELAVSEYGEEPRGVLRITSPIMIGLHKLVPLLPPFLRRYRHIKVQLDLSDDVIDPALAENDIGIRWGEQRPSSLIITRIAESRQIVCAAPAYLERFGAPRSPHELLSHNCLMMSRLGLASNEWSFLIDGEVVPLKVSGNFVVNGGHGNYEALIAGLGIGRVTDLRVVEDIRAGRLQPILREFEPDDAMGIYATFKSGRLVPPKIRLFIDYFREQMKGPLPDIAR